MDNIILTKPLSAIRDNDHITGRQVIAKILKDNPHLKRGETLKSPVALVYDGYLIDPDNPEIKTTSVCVVSRKITSERLNSESLFLGDESLDMKYIHYYTCSVGYSIANVGDFVNTFDTNYNPTYTEATQEMVDSANYVMIRFALS